MARPTETGPPKAWTLDDRIADLIGERWLELSARYALAFRAVQPGTDEELITGFLLFVDPSRDRPVAIIEPTSESWTAFNTAQYLGPWRELYAKRHRPETVTATT